MNRKITRRGFMKGAVAAGGVPLVLMPSALGLGSIPAPSNRIGLGFIGLGEMGNYLIDQFIGLSEVQVTAVCDVDETRRVPARKRVNHYYAQRLEKGTYRSCSDYNDFRDLIADRNVDAVVIATPEHWHALPALAAARAGKDIHLEKPMTLTIEEGRIVADTVKRYGRVFQHGTQQRSSPNFPRAVELVRNGRIGRLHTIEIGIHNGKSTGDHPPKPVPKSLDYDLWLGPAPWAPYTPRRCHKKPRDWSFIRDYSGGEVSGWGIHYLDIAHWAMGLDHSGPIEIEGEGVFPAKGLWNTVLTWRAECRYANGVKVVFADNKKIPLGIKLIGTEGWIHANRAGINASSKSVLTSVIRPDEIRVKTSDNHYANFLECIKTRGETVCPAETAHRSTTACHLVNIGLLLGRKVAWDPEKETILNDPTANRMIARAMRSPWHY